MIINITLLYATIVTLFKRFVLYWNDLTIKQFYKYVEATKTWKLKVIMLTWQLLTACTLLQHTVTTVMTMCDYSRLSGLFIELYILTALHEHWRESATQCLHFSMYSCFYRRPSLQFTSDSAVASLPKARWHHIRLRTSSQREGACFSLKAAQNRAIGCVRKLGSRLVASLPREIVSPQEEACSSSPILVLMPSEAFWSTEAFNKIVSVSRFVSLRPRVLWRSHLQAVHGGS